MELIIILVAIVAVTELLRLVMNYWPVSKKQHFKHKLEGVGKMIWDLEFKMYKTREIREDVRREYDQQKARLSILEEQIKNWSKDKDEGDRKKLEDQVLLIQRDINRFEQQLKQLDLECEGSKPTNEYPDGVQGISHQIDSLQELKVMIKEWLKNV